MTDVDRLYDEHVKILTRRTDASLAAMSYDALVIFAGSPPTQFLDDLDYPFKVNPHFKAWVPILDSPHSVLIHVPGRKPRILFHRPDDYWHKPAALPDAPWCESVEIIAMSEPRTAAKAWADLGRVAFIGSTETAYELPRADTNPADLLTRLHYDRAVKTAYELECMRRASVLGARGHQAAHQAFIDGGSEYDAHMAYLAACRQREEEMPYNNIVAYNENAAVLHYQNLERDPPASLRSFLIDAGAQYRGYAADITRTYAAQPGRFSNLIVELEAAQLALCEEVVSGTDYRDIHLSAHRRLGDVMRAIGLTNVPGTTALEAGVTRVFFPHGIGHLLGLQVHDVGGVLADLSGGERQRPEGHPYLRLTRRLEPGVVVTIEPGIYFIDSLLSAAWGTPRRQYIDWDVVEELKPYGGIRIEDDVVTTASVPENLTRDAFAKATAAG